MSETERQPRVGDRVLFRDGKGEDCFGAIDALSLGGGATLSLDDGRRVSGAEESNAPGAALFLNSWRVVEGSKPLPEGAEPGLWLDALCAGLVVVAIDAADGYFPLTRAGLPHALESFRRGVALVLDMGGAVMALSDRSIGRLRERIRIDAQVTSPDDMGGKAVTWSPFATLWAEVTPVPGGGEQIEGGGVAAVSTYRFTVRRRVDLGEAQRVVWPVDPMTGADIPASLLFNVRSVDLPSSGEMYMVIDAEAGVAL